MAKLSQLDKAIASFYARRDILDAAIAELESLKTKPAKKQPVARKVRQSRQVIRGNVLDEPTS